MNNASLPVRRKMAISCYFIYALIALVYSLIYLSRTEFMPHHMAMVGQNWSEVDPAYQMMILGLMKAIGGAWLALAIAISLMLLRAIRHQATWIFWAIPVIGLPPAVINLYLGINMLVNTPATPQWEIPATAVLLLVIGYVLSMNQE